MVLKHLGIHMKKTETWPILHAIYKNKPKSFIDLNVKPKTIKLKENLYDPELGKVFLSTMSKA